MKKLFILAAVAATFAACSFDKDLGESSSQTITQEERVPLSIGYNFASSAVTASSVTRGNTIDVQDENNLYTGNQVGIFILTEGNTNFATTSDFEQKNLSSSSFTADDPQSNYSKITPSSTIYYPGDKEQGIDIYVYAPYISNTTTGSSFVPGSWSDISSDKITFYTEIDQTENAKYMASDVLWGCAGYGSCVGTAYTSSTGHPYYDASYSAPSGLTSNSKISANTYATALTQSQGFTTAFYRKATKAADVVVPLLHRGSKIVVNLKTDGMLYTALKNAEVKIYVDHLQGELNLSTGTFSYSTSESAAVNGVIMTTHLGIDAVGATPTEESTYSESSIVKGYSCSAVIVPQTLTKVVTTDSHSFIEVGLKESTSTAATNAASSPGSLTATYSWKPASAPVFESGKKYIYTITVKSDGLVVDVNVVDWVDVPDDGTDKNAELQ